jgi:DNA-binding beta-propeller fold protein YncE
MEIGANTVTATVGVGSEPGGVGVDPSTHAVYVANSTYFVSVITPVSVRPRGGRPVGQVHHHGHGQRADR